MKNGPTLMLLFALSVSRLYGQSVGIGDTIPQAKLHIRSNSQSFDNSALLLNNSANQVLMNVRDNGFTGLGTSSPGTRLHIVNDFETFRIEGSSPWISFYDNFGGYKGYLWLKTGSAIELGSAAGSNAPVVIAPNNSPEIHVVPGLTGIGNSDPAFRLDISGRARIRAGISQTSGLWFNNSANTAVQAFVGVNGENTYGFYGDPVGWSLILSSVTGNAGLGADPNASRLHIRGGTSALDIGTTGPGGAALTISQGGISVAGAGISTSTVAFVHKATSANSPSGQGFTVIDNLHCNNNPWAMLQVTMNGTYGAGTAVGQEQFAEKISLDPLACQIISPTSCVIFYNGVNSGLYTSLPVYARDKWCIRTYSGCTVTDPVNFNFNVFVIKPL